MNIYLGKDGSGENVYLDFEKEEIHFILLYGDTGSGKSIFHNNLYKQLIANNTPDQLKLALIDTLYSTFTGSWKSSPYLYKPVVNKPTSAVKLLEELGEISVSRASETSNNQQKIFIHIEECDLFYIEPERTAEALAKILEYSDKNDMYVVFSSSKCPTYMPNWLLSKVDLKVIFNTVRAKLARALLGNDTISHFKEPGERILAFNDKQIYCQPFTEDEVRELAERL